jgi:hypothetical protein
LKIGVQFVERGALVVRPGNRSDSDHIGHRLLARIRRALWPYFPNARPNDSVGWSRDARLMTKRSRRGSGLDANISPKSRKREHPRLL